MAADLTRITAALNAYPWTPGAIARPDETGTHYCALGLLLRYAGVPSVELACSGTVRQTFLAFRDTLAAEYGILDFETVHAIVVANDTAASHAQAIAQVQRVLAERGDRRALLHEFIAAHRPPRPAAPPVAPWLTGEDDGGAPVPLA